MDLGLDDSAALVTASSRGLGLASATALAEADANVAICGRDAERLADAREDLAATGGGDVLAVRADVTDPDDVARLVDETVETFGGLDHVVTSAGGPPRATFLETDEREWYRAYDLLVMSVVWTLERAHRHLLESDQGTITAITSRTVREVTDGLVLSNAVRRAVEGLVKTIAREFAPEIRANTVLPGTIETGRIEDLVDARLEEGRYESREAALAALTSEIPMNRLGHPEELGDVVAVLASERASYVTGASIPVDGGQLRS
ncbi:SDR family oxidoreductase [Halopiger goleimassiliensis]|uniref:SDR family oxidoreductase n=1 Tax=Halopiger goleimassiliensis TaxID=1293048 RepID=UPI000678155E|nr:SDR family oxidoreductase [Halopiger goleimassiliensis]